MTSYNFILVALNLLLLLLSVADSSQVGCSLPDQSTIVTILTVRYNSLGGEGDASVHLIHYSYTCLAIASENRYSYLSVVVSFNASDEPNTVQNGQLQLRCFEVNNIPPDWVGSGDLTIDNDVNLFSIETRTNCSSCSDQASNDENCIDCHIDCNGGQCTGPDSSDCCPYYDAMGDCTLTCPCQNGGTCLDLTPGYACVCSVGYTGDDCMDEINECDNNLCSNGVTCINVIDGFVCICTEGYTGDNCDNDTNDCADNPCNNGATCIDQVANYTCVCLEGFTGDICDINIDDCASDPCENGAICLDQVADYTCVCIEGFTGDNCDINIDDCASDPCENGAICLDQVADYTCVCIEGFTGDNCDINIDDCDSDPCENGAICLDQVADYTCVCLEGFTGDNCDINIDDCASDPCENGAICLDEVANYTCVCLEGFTGDNCDNDIDDCANNPCDNGATCIDQVADYTCVCENDYTGTNCEDPLNAFEKCNLTCEDTNIFEKDLCLFYCQSEEWRQAAILSGITLPEISSELVDASASERWEKAVADHQLYLDVWLEFSEEQGLVFFNDESIDDMSPVSIWESEITSTQQNLILWRDYAKAIKPSLNFANLENINITEDPTAEELDSIYTTFSNQWSNDLEDYIREFN